jgi:NADPH-dependent glutamate synthase beta subunit-like oxidoreductase
MSATGFDDQPTGEPTSGWLLDDGLNGFLPPGPPPDSWPRESVATAGANPDFHKHAPITTGQCLVNITRLRLYDHWKNGECSSADQRQHLARAARLAAQIALRQGAAWMLDELENLARKLSAFKSPAAATLRSSLDHFPALWKAHIHGDGCADPACPPMPPPLCQSGCPAHIDIPGFMARIAHGDWAGAVEVIVKDNPLPYVCGLICPGPCESECLRREIDSAVNIRPLKAVAARNALSLGGYPKVDPAPATGKRVAVVGSGPAGLTAAFYLARKGHSVRIFEAEPEAGGMLRYGIPAFRLPREILAREIAWIERAGVQIETSRRIDHLENLFDQGYDAVYVAIGTQMAREIPVEGIDLPFVLHGLDFLKAVNHGKGPRVGPKVVVLGGGNVAIDVAMTALRQGVSMVRMVCLEQRPEMPANPHEIAIAEQEGIVVENGWGPLRITAEQRITFQACTRVFDTQGVFNPAYEADKTLTLEADHVVLAIGQAADLSCVLTVDEVDIERGLICVDPQTAATDDPRVFAGGDVVNGPGLAISAVRAGKQAAESIDAALQLRAPNHRRWSQPQTRTEVTPVAVSATDRAGRPRAQILERPPEERVCDFACVEMELDETAARQEAERCLRCDLCIGCGLCELACSEMGCDALLLGPVGSGRLFFKDFMGPQDRCIGCGACHQVCPTGAIEVMHAEGAVRTVFTGTAVAQQPLVACVRCGKPAISERYRQTVLDRLQPNPGLQVESSVCAACTRRTQAEARRAVASRYTGMQRG